MKQSKSEKKNKIFTQQKEKKTFCNVWIYWVKKKQVTNSLYLA